MSERDPSKAWSTDHVHEFAVPIEWETYTVPPAYRRSYDLTERTRVTRLRCRVGTCEETKDVHHG